MTEPQASEAGWRAMSAEGAPSARSNFVSVWTGSKWFVWSGILGLKDGRHVLANDGALYDPATDRWTPLSAKNAPVQRFGALGVWTGEHVLVWGGRGSYPDPDPNDGALYDPAKDEWIPLGSADATAGRSYQCAEWIGDSWYWLCGTRFNSRMNDGARFDRATRKWTHLTWPDAPKPRWDHASAWTGEEVLMFGGFGARNGYATENVAYNPKANTWRLLNAKSAPSRRTHHSVVWTGKELCIWGGISTVGGKDLTKGGLYDPKTDTWRKVSPKNEPSGRANNTLLWTGKEVLVWGGDIRHAPHGTLAGPGGLYDPEKHTWRPLPPGEPPARSGHGAVWTGTELLVWGGSNPKPDYTTTFLGSGYRLRL